MAARPSNIGIKAIELYFPSQVSYYPRNRPATRMFLAVVPL